MDMLQVRGDQIVDERGQAVRLRGWGVGGWMNTENFINGYPGIEQTLRATCARELGPEKAAQVWDTMIDAFFEEDDVRFMREAGATVVRLPLNYRHFEDDAAPGRWLEAGFARLERALGWCRKHGLYAILDGHAVPGFQDPDWHSDNPTRSSLIWSEPAYQDRFVALWEEFARRYKNDATVAGYNVMNEPVTGAPFGFHGFPITCDFAPLNALYRRVVRAIRTIDPDHIIYLEGDFFSSRFAGLDPPPDRNLVYSSHLYLKAGFGPGPYPGSFEGETWDRALIGKKLVEQEGTVFCRQHGVPLWVGEFGGAFNVPRDDRAFRVQADDDQIDAFEAQRLHWTIWTYKDVGMMGAAVVDPESPYLKLVEPVLRQKTAVATDSWVSNVPETKVRRKVRELGDALLDEMPDLGLEPALFHKYFAQAVLSLYAGRVLETAWARRFRDLSLPEIHRVMQSFSLAHCRRHEELLAVLRRHMARPA